jgi:hypothetical protein
MISGGYGIFALACRLRMIFFENRRSLFGIMLRRKPQPFLPVTGLGGAEGS